MSKTRRLRPDQNFTKGKFVARRVLQPGILGRCAWATLHLLLGATTTIVGWAATAVAPSRRVARAKFWIENSYSVHRVSMRKTQCATAPCPKRLHKTKSQTAVGMLGFGHGWRWTRARQDQHCEYRPGWLQRWASKTGLRPRSWRG